jgi:capsular polysaccharide biosynthesis protein
MEVRLYWRILRRRWWLPVSIVALAVTAWFGMRLLRPAPPLYQVSMRFSVGVVPEAKESNVYHYDRYYTYLASEYLVDDFSEVVKSGAFAQAVSQRLAQSVPPIQVPAGAIQGSTQAGKLHRILTVTITWGDAETLQRIAEAVVAELRENNARYFAQLGVEGAEAFLLDTPSVHRVGPGLWEKLDLPIRLVLALTAGVGLVFLWEYFDDSIRDREDLEAVGLRVLAEIPRR